MSDLENTVKCNCRTLNKQDRKLKLLTTKLKSTNTHTIIVIQIELNRILQIDYFSNRMIQISNLLWKLI